MRQTTHERGNVVRFPTDALYAAKQFTAAIGPERFKISGTLCGCIDLAAPGGPTFALTPDEAFSLAHALLNSRQDVLDNSRPRSDPRLYGEA